MQRLCLSLETQQLYLSKTSYNQRYFTPWFNSVLLTEAACRLPGQSFPLMVQGSFKKTKKLSHLRKDAWPDLVKDRNKVVSEPTWQSPPHSFPNESHTYLRWC